MGKGLRCIGIILLVGLFLSVFGAERAEERVVIYTLGTTFTFFDVKELNAKFKSYNIEELSMPQTCWSFEFAWFKKGLALASWMFMKLDRIKSESLEIWTNRMMFFWKVRYLLPVTKNLSLFISSGLGGYYYGLDLTPTSLTEASFDSILVGPGARRSCRMSDMGLSLCIEGGSLFLLPFKRYLIGLNIKGGYIFSPLNTGLGLEDGESLRGVPKLSMNSPYISLGLSFGGKRTKEE